MHMQTNADKRIHALVQTLADKCRRPYADVCIRRHLQTSADSDTCMHVSASPGSVMVRLPRSLVDRIDAVRGGVPRDRWLRNLVSDTLAARDPAPIPGQTTIDDVLHPAPGLPSIAPAPIVRRGSGKRPGGARSRQSRASSAGEAGVSEPGRGGGADLSVDPAARSSQPRSDPAQRDDDPAPPSGGESADQRAGDARTPRRRGRKDRADTGAEGAKSGQGRGGVPAEALGDASGGDDPAALSPKGCPECGGTVADGACQDCGWKAGA